MQNNYQKLHKFHVYNFVIMFNLSKIFIIFIAGSKIFPTLYQNFP